MKPKGRIPWEEMAASPNFRDLLKKKARFIVAGTAFFLIYYFALPVLSGYWRELMASHTSLPFHSFRWHGLLRQSTCARLLALTGRQKK
jgi:uncharacterized membrane protein (DUF485 family)